MSPTHIASESLACAFPCVLCAHCCLLLLCVVLCNSLIRECRGAQAIGRDSREKIIFKFDHAWKQLLISAVVQAGHITHHTGGGAGRGSGGGETHTETEQSTQANTSWSQTNNYTFV